MRQDDDLMPWLAAQALGVAVRIDGESVYLRAGVGGAELGAYLWSDYTSVQLEDAMRQGFAGALEFEAGLGCAPDGPGLVLSQWLPQVDDWRGAAPALEQLLNQLAQWRAALAPARPGRRPTHGAVERHAQRMRNLLAGGGR